MSERLAVHISTSCILHPCILLNIGLYLEARTSYDKCKSLSPSYILLKFRLYTEEMAGTLQELRNSNCDASSVVLMSHKYHRGCI